ncbi:MAG: GNAT family N-acetyltransferase [Chloroflexota bacterium]|nr:GNAT family N-acetyltransferase [Chloroflexota bacterium]
MLISQRMIIRPVEEEDQKQLANLIHFENHVHRHLDWRTPLEWIGRQPFLVAEADKRIVAALACPPDPPGVAWIRLFAVGGSQPLQKSWQDLWQEAVARLNQLDEIEWSVAIPLWKWFRELIEGSGFQENNRVVMLNWDRGNALPRTTQTGIKIRAMNLDDIKIVHRLDSDSFDPVWRVSLQTLNHSLKLSVISTIAELDRQVVGYQISTSTTMGGHLARLAVSPEVQGQGIGYALICDLLNKFDQRGAERITVNTQKDNHASLKMYRKSGFKLSGDEYPVYVYALN